MKKIVDKKRKVKIMKTFKNISDKWGDAIEITVDDYKKQAAIFGVDVEIEERSDGIYIDGEKVAE